MASVKFFSIFLSYVPKSHSFVVNSNFFDACHVLSFRFDVASVILGFKLDLCRIHDKFPVWRRLFDRLEKTILPLSEHLAMITTIVRN